MSATELDDFEPDGPDFTNPSSGCRHSWSSLTDGGGQCGCDDAWRDATVTFHETHGGTEDGPCEPGCWIDAEIAEFEARAAARELLPQCPVTWERDGETRRCIYKADGAHTAAAVRHYDGHLVHDVVPA